jgi:hypothetical protein
VASTPAEKLMFRTAWKVREMIDRGEVDPHVGLSWVAWPPEALEQVAASVETRESAQAGGVTRTGDEPAESDEENRKRGRRSLCVGT